MSNVIFVGEPPFRPTGWGRIIDNMVKHSDIDMSCIGSVHFGNQIDYFSTKVYPRLKYKQGYDALPGVIDKEKPNYVITCGDIGPQLGFVNIISDIKKTYTKLEWYPYVTVDALNMPSWVPSRLKGADKVIVLSEYGKRLLKSVGVESIHIPASCDTELFKPQKNKLIIKKSIMDGKFVVLSVGINQTRKAWGTLLEGFAKFAENKSDVFFLLHTDMQPFNRYDGWDLNFLIREFGLTGKCAFTDQQTSSYWRHNITPKMMVEIYNIADVGLFAGAEGFGCPILEIQACGKPVVIGDQCVAEELVGNHGLRVPINHYILGNVGAKYGVPSVDGIAAALEKYYKDRKLMKQHGRLARKHALNYDVKVVAKKLSELLK